MKSLEFKYLILPIILLIFVIGASHFLKFLYVNQLIIISGPIMAALVTLYVTRDNENKNESVRQISRDTKLDYIFSLIENGLYNIHKEVENYREFTKQIEKEGMGQVGFKFSSLHMLEQSIKYNQGEFYSSIANKFPNDTTNARKQYIRLSNASQNVILLQENAKSEYEKFIVSHNKQAEIFRKSQMDLNNIHAALSVNPSGVVRFDEDFFNIIREYNQKIFAKEISPAIFDDVRQNLVIPLAKLLNSGFVPQVAFYQIQRVQKELEVSLNKMEEIQNIAISHINDISNHLEEVAAKLNDALLYFGVNIEVADRLELEQIEPKNELIQPPKQVTNKQKQNSPNIAATSSRSSCFSFFSS